MHPYKHSWDYIRVDANSQRRNTMVHSAEPDANYPNTAFAASLIIDSSSLSEEWRAPKRIPIVKKLQPLYPYLWRYRRRYVLGFAVLLCDVAFWVVIPLIIKAAIDNLQESVTVDKLV